MVKHLAIQMDGNRRWAKKNALESYIGHKYGAQAAQTAVNFCLDQNIPFLSLYTFSLENFKRSEIEKNYVFNLLVQEAKNKIDEYIKKEVRIKFVGDRSLFPESVLPTCLMLEEKTKHLKKLQVNLLFCYGSKQEIISAVKNIVNKLNIGEITQDQITEELFSNCLWTNGTPEPDIVIKTGKNIRLSNFLLYQSAYSELFFLDCLWPDIKTDHLEQVIDQFKERQRNFGT